MKDTDHEIRSTSHPECILCGTIGVVVYRNLRDQLFGAPGNWMMRQCPNPQCSLLWLDPMPLADDIGKAYLNYYTHIPTDNKRSHHIYNRLIRFIKRGYWEHAYQYRLGATSLLAMLAGRLIYLSPIHRREADAEVRCLPAVPAGRLLDLGCGSGRWLLTMKALGWDVEGVDFDNKAVNAARRTGLNVRLGALDQQNFPDKSFDAITLNNVIEHLPDPISTLRECRRILKPGGTLVLVTPNSSSFSRWLFKDSWRGLEPPRHLYIFSHNSIVLAIQQAGFSESTVHPFIVTSVIYDSIISTITREGSVRASRRNWLVWGLTQFLKLIELCILTVKPTIGDCLIAVSRR